MNTALAHKPATALRQLTAPVRDHAAAMERAREAYFKALKREEGIYFEKVRKITAAMAGEVTAAESAAS